LLEGQGIQKEEEKKIRVLPLILGSGNIFFATLSSLNPL